MCISGQRAPRPVETFSLEMLAEYKPVSVKKSHAHITVQHDYHDHSHETTDDAQAAELFQGQGGNFSFPYKLYDMLSRVDAEGHSHIVSFQPHGRSFVVHKPEAFKALLSHYFNVSKIASFQRQLNLYGFTRLTRGPDRGGYYHECFLRGKPGLLPQIRRMKVKGTGVRARSNPETEPDFYNMAWVAADDSSQHDAPVTTSMHASASSIISDDESDRLMASEDTKVPLALPRSDIITGWGKQFHYLDIAAPDCPLQNALPSSMYDEQLLNDADIEKEIDDLLMDEGDFDLLARLESIVADDEIYSSI